MKKVFLGFFASILLLSFGCQQNSYQDNETEVKEEDRLAEDITDVSTIENWALEEDSLHFGKIIESEGSISMDDFATKIEGEDTLRVKIEAVATEICQKKGCWMKVETSEGKSLRIRFKDYGFFVPKDIAGRNVVFEGIAFKDTISVEELRHYAEDEGKSEEEIAAITEPKVKTSFIANGVLIK